MTIALLYHDVVEEGSEDTVGFPGPVAARYKLTPSRFESHLDALAHAGCEVGLVEPTRPLPSLALTFDDGGASSMWIAAAVERRGWRCHIFVTTARVGTPGFLTASEIRELADRGHGIGSHSHTHPASFGRLPRDEIDGEWLRSRDLLGEALGRPPALAAVPGGSMSPAVARSAEAAGYAGLLTSTPTSRARRQGAMLILGRYAIWATTPAATAVAYATGAWLPRSRLRLAWAVKSGAKRLSPTVYEALRRRRAQV